jgi:hypothetical protein
MFGDGRFYFHRKKRFGKVQKEKIIFLDIDGVLNHSEATEDLDDSCLLELQKLVQDTGAKIVLTSSWKFYFLRGDENPSREYIEKRFSDYGLSLYGIAPDLGTGKRGTEIMTWLHRHREVHSFVILDDCFFPDFQKLKKHVCLTDWGNHGFTASHREKAMEILKEK